MIHLVDYIFRAIYYGFKNANVKKAGNGKR